MGDHASRRSPPQEKSRQDNAAGQQHGTSNDYVQCLEHGKIRAILFNSCLQGHCGLSADEVQDKLVEARSELQLRLPDSPLDLVTDQEIEELVKNGRSQEMRIII